MARGARQVKKSNIRRNTAAGWTQGRQAAKAAGKSKTDLLGSECSKDIQRINVDIAHRFKSSAGSAAAEDRGSQQKSGQFARNTSNLSGYARARQVDIGQIVECCATGKQPPSVQDNHNLTEFDDARHWLAHSPISRPQFEHGKPGDNADAMAQTSHPTYRTKSSAQPFLDYTWREPQYNQACLQQYLPAKEQGEARHREYQHIRVVEEPTRFMIPRQQTRAGLKGRLRSSLQLSRKRPGQHSPEPRPQSTADQKLQDTLKIS